MSKSKKCTFLVMGCDEYTDVLEINAVYKQKYWKKCSFPYVLVTQTQVPERNVYDRIVYTSAEVTWMDRLKKALDTVDTPYVCIMCDDYYYSRNVNEDRLLEMIGRMKKENVGELKILPTNLKRGLSKRDKDFYEYGNEHAFRISYYPSIWKVEYLKKYSNSGLSVWQAERDNSIESKKYSEKIWTVRRNEFSLLHTIMSGMWTREAVKSFKEEDIPPDMYNSRETKNVKMYIKDLVFNLVMTICPNLTLKLQRKYRIGRGY